MSKMKRELLFKKATLFELFCGVRRFKLIDHIFFYKEIIIKKKLLLSSCYIALKIESFLNTYYELKI